MKVAANPNKAVQEIVKLLQEIAVDYEWFLVGYYDKFREPADDKYCRLDYMCLERDMDGSLVGYGDLAYIDIPIIGLAIDKFLAVRNKLCTAGFSLDSDLLKELIVLWGEICRLVRERTISTEHAIESIISVKENGFEIKGNHLLSKKIESKIERVNELLRSLHLQDKSTKPKLAPPTGPRLELDEGRKRFRIGKSWHDYTGDNATVFLNMLLKAEGTWQPGSNLVSDSRTRADRVRKNLPKPIQKIIETKPGGTGGYRIKLKYFLLT